MAAPQNEISASTHSRLKVIAELSGVIAAVLVLLAIIRVYVHYQYYHINIVPYLDFSEIILSIFSDLKVLFRLLIMLTGNFFLVPIIWSTVPNLVESWYNRKVLKENKPEPKNKVWYKIFSFEKITSPNTRYASRILLGVLGFLIITYSVFRHKDISNTSISDATFYISSVAISFGLFTIVWVTVNHFYKAAIIATLLLFFLIFILLGKHDPTLDQQNAKTEQWEFITATDTITTNDQFYLAGRTNHYYFLYDQHSRKTTIIPVAEIKSSSVEYIRDESNRLRDILPDGIKRLWKK